MNLQTWLTDLGHLLLLTCVFAVTGGRVKDITAVIVKCYFKLSAGYKVLATCLSLSVFSASSLPIEGAVYSHRGSMTSKNNYQGKGSFKASLFKDCQ